MMKTYAFIDRDGTLIYEPPDTGYVDSIDKLRILPGVIEKLKRFKAKGYQLIMVTNQDYLGKDYNPRNVFDEVQDELYKRLASSGIKFDEVLICPHGDDEGCLCRKPETGLVDHLKDIDKDKSFIIGDRESDTGFAENLGIKIYKLEPNQGMEGVVL